MSSREARTLPTIRISSMVICLLAYSTFYSKFDHLYFPRKLFKERNLGHFESFYSVYSCLKEKIISCGSDTFKRFRRKQRLFSPPWSSWSLGRDV